MHDSTAHSYQAQRGAAAYGLVQRTSLPGARLSLVIDAYDRALAAIKRAADHDRAGRLDEELRAALEAISLFQGLSSMVDPSAGPVSQTLLRMYGTLETAMHSTIRTTDGADSYDRLHAAVKDLRDAWVICSHKA